MSSMPSPLLPMPTETQCTPYAAHALIPSSLLVRSPAVSLMDAYNMKRIHIGLDVGVDPIEFMNMQEDFDKQLLAKLEPNMVKVYGMDDAMQTIMECSGFLYNEEPNIMTSGHAYLFGKRAATGDIPASSGATSFRVVYHDGSSESVSVAAKPMPQIDAMILHGTRPGPNDQHALAMASRGDIVYVAGYPPDTTQVCISKGMLSATTFDSWFVTAHADSGWSGGPVVNKFGKLIGLVELGAGVHQKMVRVVPAQSLHIFARFNGMPGLLS